MIEKNLERIANSLEIIANYYASKNTCKKRCSQAKKDKIPSAPEEKNTTESEKIVNEHTYKAEEEKLPKEDVDSPNEVMHMSIEEANKELIEQYNRLGQDRIPIDNAIKKHGVTSLSEIDPSKYIDIIEDIKKIDIPSKSGME